jgi:hypothetical protein
MNGPQSGFTPFPHAGFPHKRDFRGVVVDRRGTIRGHIVVILIKEIFPNIKHIGVRRCGSPAGWDDLAGGKGADIAGTVTVLLDFFWNRGSHVGVDRIKGGISTAS